MMGGVGETLAPRPLRFLRPNHLESIVPPIVFISFSILLAPISRYKGWFPKHKLPSPSLLSRCISIGFYKNGVSAEYGSIDSFLSISTGAV